MILEISNFIILDAVRPKFGKPTGALLGRFGYEPETFVPILQ